MKPSVRLAVTACASAVVLFAADAAWACPMCKAAAEADPRLPRAFMASILFMLSMPFVLVVGFGTAFYRLSKKRVAEGPGRGDETPPVAP